MKTLYEVYYYLKFGRLDAYAAQNFPQCIERHLAHASLYVHWGLWYGGQPVN
jgi:hypothetical protein